MRNGILLPTCHYLFSRLLQLLNNPVHIFNALRKVRVPTQLCQLDLQQVHDIGWLCSVFCIHPALREWCRGYVPGLLWRPDYLKMGLLDGEFVRMLESQVLEEVKLRGMSAAGVTVAGSRWKIQQVTEDKRYSTSTSTLRKGTDMQIHQTHRKSALTPQKCT